LQLVDIYKAKTFVVLYFRNQLHLRPNDDTCKQYWKVDLCWKHWYCITFSVFKIRNV